jgi:hypothetical protein
MASAQGRGEASGCKAEGITRTLVVVSHVRESMSKSNCRAVFVQSPVEEWINPKLAFHGGVRKSNHRGQVDRK